MGRLQVVVTDYVEPDLEWERERLAEAGVELIAHHLKHAPAKELAAATRQADMIIVNMASITAELVSSWERCRLLLRHGVGFDNVDVPALTARGIPFANIPDYCIEEMAEQTIALLFAAARKLVFSRSVLERSVALGQWDYAGCPPIFRLRGKKLGIVGCGRIGMRVCQKLAGFGMEFLICDPHVGRDRARQLGVELLPLEQVLREADLITLHAALNDETRGMIDAGALALMKPTAFLVNTARAGLIDQGALVEALQRGTLAGAALDVYDHEPPLPDDPLLEMDHVILTPHLGWYSVESEWDIRRKIVDQVLRFAKGEPPLNCLNLAAIERSGRSGQI